jgi:hypothetical protein
MIPVAVGIATVAMKHHEERALGRRIVFRSVSENLQMVGIDRDSDLAFPVGDGAWLGPAERTSNETNQGAEE